MKRTPLASFGKRRRKTYAEKFGARADAVRSMPCLVAAKHFEDQAGHSAHIQSLLELGHPAHTLACRGEIEAAHIDGSRGAGHDRRSLGPFCAHHHGQSGERGKPHERSTLRRRFESLYGIDCRVEAKRIALELDEAGLP